MTGDLGDAILRRAFGAAQNDNEIGGRCFRYRREAAGRYVNQAGV